MGAGANRSRTKRTFNAEFCISLDTLV
uniref:Uncharacterized protein n=1 Tax=Arundo donax TaxID=35708 RepID=A0A0A9CGP2_ARUDO